MYEVGLAQQSVKGEDRALVREDVGLFAVFDGAGGEVNGDLAAEAAKQIFEQAKISNYLERPAKSWQMAQAELKAIMQQANEHVAEAANGGITTATAAQIVLATEAGEVMPFAIWSSVGDSRLYLQRDNSLQMLSQDEGHRQWLINFLGKTEDQTGLVRQVGAAALRANDLLLLVTDGITGDYGTDVLADDEIINACIQAYSAVAAAQNLLKISRKTDDKTALVIRLK
jgi:serine/threonine protein phosphatase PrpC